MTSFALKLIAIITMLIDHIGAIFFPQEAIYRIIGRIALPIFVFLLVEGFSHTSNIKKYLTRLGIFAFISEIPFDLAFYATRYNSNVITDIGKGLDNPGFLKEIIFGRFMNDQNIFFTLFIGLLGIYLMSKMEEKYKSNMLMINLINAGITIACCALALILKTDYSIGGILFIIAFYLFRDNKILIGLSLLIITGIMFRDSNGNMTIQAYDILAMIPIAFYNGKKGKSIKYFFYVFYPAHLIVLWLISILV